MGGTHGSKTYKETYEINRGGDLLGNDIKRLQTNDKHLRIHHIKHTESQFRTNYERIKPFVLAY